MTIEKVPQVQILHQTDSVARSYTWQSYVNERIRTLARQRGISQVRVVSIDEKICILSYLEEMSREEI